MTENPSAKANKFMKDNLKAIAKERVALTPSLMPKNALYLQATRLFAEVPGGIDAPDATENALNRLCLAFTANAEAK